MTIEIPFNDWSKERIRQGRKRCTSRSKLYGKEGDAFEVQGIWYELLGSCWLPLKFIAEYLYALEGADSPAEFEQVWRGLHRGKFNGAENKFVHFFDEVVV